MNIHRAMTDEELLACYPVLCELRPHLKESRFVDRIRHQERNGYSLACVTNEEGVVAIAGYRIGQNLAWGRFLYVDDLVTAANQRSKGYGAALLSWLREVARNEGCAQLHLDSGLQREDAHRFYSREGLAKTGFHFVEALSPDNPLHQTSGRDATFHG